MESFVTSFFQYSVFKAHPCFMCLYFTFFMAKYNSIVWIDFFCLFVHLLMDIWIVLYLLVIMKTVDTNICVQVSEWARVFTSLGYT